MTLRCGGIGRTTRCQWTVCCSNACRARGTHTSRIALTLQLSLFRTSSQCNLPHRRPALVCACKCWCTLGAKLKLSGSQSGAGQHKHSGAECNQSVTPQQPPAKLQPAPRPQAVAEEAWQHHLQARHRVEVGIIKQHFMSLRAPATTMGCVGGAAKEFCSEHSQWSKCVNSLVNSWFPPFIVFLKKTCT